MAVVEVGDAHARPLKRPVTYDKSNPARPHFDGERMSGVGKAGLEDVVVSTSDICFIDGHEGRLVYRGYDVDDLVAHSSFEEVVYLLWHGSLPSKKDFASHVKALGATATRRLPPKLVSLLRTLPRRTPPMAVLRTGVSALAAFDPDAADNSREATIRKSIRLTAQMPTLVAAWERIRRGKAPVAPDPRMDLATNFLAMLTGRGPSPLAAKTFDTALILHADHEFNASTFAARVTAATLSDVHSAVTSAIGTLQGPLHGGANEQVMRMVEQIRSPATAEAWTRGALADKVRIMGFGHRVYRVEDPRAKHLRRLAWELGRQTGDDGAVRILDTIARVVSEEKHLFPNVDLYSGAAYRALGVPTDQFTPIFALSRVAGWTAHVLEQHGNNRLIRPRAEYTGVTRASYVPIDQR
jgi:citrate synthase